MGRHRARRERALGSGGQASFEYALVTVAVLAVAGCFGAVVDFLQGGAFAQAVVKALARRVPDGVLDILMF